MIVVRISCDTGKVEDKSELARRIKEVCAADGKKALSVRQKEITDFDLG